VTRYTFSDEILTSPSKRVPSGPAAPWRNSESSEQDLKLMELENSMASKVRFLLLLLLRRLLHILLRHRLLCRRLLQ
jgi:hypothetical protein